MCYSFAIHLKHAFYHPGSPSHEPLLSLKYFIFFSSLHTLHSFTSTSRVDLESSRFLNQDLHSLLVVRRHSFQQAGLITFFSENSLTFISNHHVCEQVFTLSPISRFFGWHLGGVLAHELLSHPNRPY